MESKYSCEDHCAFVQKCRGVQRQARHVLDILDLKTESVIDDSQLKLIDTQKIILEERIIISEGSIAAAKRQCAGGPTVKRRYGVLGHRALACASPLGKGYYDELPSDTAEGNWEHSLAAWFGIDPLSEPEPEPTLGDYYKQDWEM